MEHQQAIDPVCGMTVDPKTAKHKAEHKGHTYYFCSAGCRTKFVATPEKYLDKVEEPAVAGAIYTCPMHPEIRQVGPGSCPICGMALEPVTVTAESGPNPELADMTRRFWIGLGWRFRFSSWKWADISPGSPCCWASSFPTGCNSRSPHRWCCGRAGRSSCAAGNRWSRAISTCSR